MVARLDFDTDFRLSDCEKDLECLKDEIKELKEDFAYFKEVITVQLLQGLRETQASILSIQETVNKSDYAKASELIETRLDDIRDEFLHLDSLKQKQQASAEKHKLSLAMEVKQPEKDLFDRVWDDLADNDVFLKLTEREKQVLKSRTQGKTFREIALEITGGSTSHPGYASCYLTRACRKARCFTSKELAELWQQRVDNYSRKNSNER